LARNERLLRLASDTDESQQPTYPQERHSLR
jgi:hypothetical protein